MGTGSGIGHPGTGWGEAKRALAEWLAVVALVAVAAVDGGSSGASGRWSITLQAYLCLACAAAVVAAVGAGRDRGREGWRKALAATVLAVGAPTVAVAATHAFTHARDAEPTGMVCALACTIALGCLALTQRAGGAATATAPAGRQLRDAVQDAFAQAAPRDLADVMARREAIVVVEGRPFRLLLEPLDGLP